MTNLERFPEAWKVL